MNIVGVGLHVIEQTLLILADFVLKTPKVCAHKVKCIGYIKQYNESVHLKVTEISIWQFFLMV